MGFKAIKGISPKDLESDFKSKSIKLSIEMGKVLMPLIRESEDKNLALTALQFMYPSIMSQFFERDAETLSEVAEGLAKGVIENMKVIIETIENDKNVTP